MNKNIATEYFLEDAYFTHDVIFLLDLFFGSLGGPYDLGKSLRDGLIIVFDVILHSDSKLFDGSFQFLLLLLPVPFFASFNQLQKTVTSCHLSLVVLDKLVDLGLKVTKNRA